VPHLGHYRDTPCKMQNSQRCSQPVVDPGFWKGGFSANSAVKGSAYRGVVSICVHEVQKNFFTFIFHLAGWALMAPPCFALQVPDIGFSHSYLVHDIVLNLDEDGNLRTAKSTQKVMI